MEWQGDGRRETGVCVSEVRSSGVAGVQTIALGHGRHTSAAQLFTLLPFYFFTFKWCFGGSSMTTFRITVTH